MDKGYNVRVSTYKKDPPRQQIDVEVTFYPYKNDQIIHLIWYTDPSDERRSTFDHMIVSVSNIKVLSDPAVIPLLSEIAKIDNETQPEEFITVLHRLGFQLIQ